MAKAKKRKVAVGATLKTKAQLPLGKGKAVSKLQKRIKMLDRMTRQELLNFLQKKKFARKFAKTLGTTLEKMPKDNLESVAITCILRAQHRIASSSDFFYRKLSEDRLAMMRKVVKRLKEKGILCEDIVSASKVKGYFVVKTANLGKSLLQSKITKKTIDQIIGLIGKVHSESVVHGHPHKGNIVVDKKGNLGLIDFDWARLAKVDWSNPASIYLTFNRDYYHLYRAFKRYIGSEKGARNFFSKLVSKYPASKKVKASVVDSIENFIVHEIQSRR